MGEKVTISRPAFKRGVDAVVMTPRQWNARMRSLTHRRLTLRVTEWLLIVTAPILALMAIGWTGYQAWRMVGYWTGWW